MRPPYPEKVAIAHYHLRPGGVTRVIESVRTALRGRGVIAAEIIAEGFDYCAGDDAPDAATLAKVLRESASGAEILHIHNPTLGKHLTLPDALATLAAEGDALLLQIHDFAEDGRSQNMRVAEKARTLYPPAHYATVNSRDRDILIAAGLAPERAHFLPNPVALVPEPPALPESDRPLIFYPVRGIARKNLGEVALLASVAGDRARFAIAAAPENPQWLEQFEEWRAFCEELELPVEFGVVEDRDGRRFEDWYAAADVIVTTSVAEGFGLAFLESFAKGRPLLGRDLPEITKDFRENGLSFDGLYNAIVVPVEGVDFALLEPAQQRVLIRELKSDPTRAEAFQVQIADEMQPLPEWLHTNLRGHREEIAPNREAIGRHYSLEGYADRLTEIYARVLAEPPEDVEIDRDKVHETFRRRSLVRLIRSRSRALAAEPTRMAPQLEPLDGVRAVLFDIYGTLLVSGAGGAPPTELADEIERAHERARAAGEQFPEVDIREIWRAVLGRQDVDEHAVRFECEQNPVWPMPHLAELFSGLRGRDLTMGVISNAQFMTPLLFDALLGQPCGELGFDPDLCFWSFREACAKPSPVIFERAVAALEKRGIGVGEAIFVGNDMRNDIAPAAAAGFRTALFAGCGRSLRLREGEPQVEGVRPDLVITDLAQLLPAIGH